ncbi:hypothetical protein, conserved [Angomonas deanei]|uniref:PGAP2IP C-terminal nuclease-like domain-containing protein n=1 Tax=Angomonas deanei TaxID=59799 RepID=A0A7G2C977_9TRYP|nr:hypothetical protein, conserved [Angomonas deanei]
MSGILRRLFRASFLRVFSVAMVSCFILLNGTRQTNFTFEKKHDGYPVTTKTDLKDLDIAHWDEQVGFSGSKYLALLAGLVLTFLYGAVSPLITEICLAHQRARRLTILEETGELEAIYRKEPKSVMKSFEFSLGIVFFILGYSYIVAVSYPFIPFGDIMRERTRSVYFVNTTAVFGLVWYVGLRLRRTSRLILDKNIVPAQRQRSIQFFMLVLVGIAFIVVITGRVGLMEEDRSFPAGKTTAVDYRKEVLHIHHIMMDLLVERNRGTDTTLPEYVTEFIKEDYDFKWNEMRKNITETKENEYVNKTYQLNHLNKDVRKDVFAAAEAMSSYIGLIWTVHFGLDNYNVDSFNRMAKWAVKLNAGVIGLLESDAMHFVTGNRDMTEYMSYHTGFRYTDYGSPLIDSTYGCTIISRYPIKSVRRYVLPSPIGELACAVLAELDIYGLTVRTFVGHFGNTEHKADGILQSKYLGKLAKNTVGPAVWLGYLVTHPGESKHYGEYSDPAKPGLFRDAGLDMYVNRPWTELVERGGYHEVPPPFEKKDPEAPHDFDVEFKLHYVKEIAQLEKALGRPPDDSFRRPPANESRRHFYFNATNRYALDHPRFEFMDRYCQYSLYKTGKAKDELPENREKVQPIAAELFDWRRVVEPVADISDTEIQLIQLLFTERTE